MRIVATVVRWAIASVGICSGIVVGAVAGLLLLATLTTGALAAALAILPFAVMDFDDPAGRIGRRLERRSKAAAELKERHRMQGVRDVQY